MKLHTAIFPFEIKAVPEPDADPALEPTGEYFSGVGACFNSLDYMGDIFAPGAFTKALPFTMTEGKIRDEHAVTTGSIVDAAEAPEGLRVKGRISATTNGLDQRILVKDGVINRLSVGYIVTAKPTYLENPEQVKSYWASVGYTPTDQDLTILGRSGGARLITEAKAYEVSTTWRPVNDSARITEVKGGDGQARLPFEQCSDATLTAVEELIGRAEAIRQLRAEDGRGLSVKSLARLGAIHTQLATLLAATSPPATDQVDADLALFDSYLANGARLSGGR